jgi:hypothetical protein
MNKPLKITLITLGALAAGGAVLYFMTKKKPETGKSDGAEAPSEDVAGKTVIFTKDGFMYKMDKSQAYPKKQNEWGGIIQKSFDDEYYQVKNTKAQDFLVKKSDVKIK